jgi:uncharacterized protein YkwD
MSRRRPLMPVIAAIAGLAVFAAPSAAQANPTACQSSHLSPSPENVRQVEQTVLCLLNAERTRRGLPRLRDNARLETAADRHSKDMVRRGFFAHDTPAGSSPSDRIRAAGYLKGARGWSVGENIAYGTGSYATPQSIVKGWMNSAGHKRNILHRSFEEIGVGVALGAPGSGSSGATYTTTFGARQ